MINRFAWRLTHCVCRPSFLLTESAKPSRKECGRVSNFLQQNLTLSHTLFSKSYLPLKVIEFAFPVYTKVGSAFRRFCDENTPLSHQSAYCHIVAYQDGDVPCESRKRRLYEPQR